MKINYAFTVFLIVLMGSMSVGAFAFEGTAAFGFPFAVASIVCLMGIALLVADLRADSARRYVAAEKATRAKQPNAPEATRADESEGGNIVDLAGLSLIYAFLIGFLAIAHFLSFLAAAPLFLFLLCWLFCRERWVSSAVLAGVVGVFVFLVFHLVLNTF